MCLVQNEKSLERSMVSGTHLVTKISIDGTKLSRPKVGRWPTRVVRRFNMVPIRLGLVIRPERQRRRVVVERACVKPLVRYKNMLRSVCISVLLFP